MKIYSVAKVDGEMIITPNRKGRYRADSAEEIKRALTELGYIPPTAEVRVSKTWFPLKRGRYSPKKKEPKRPYSEPQPIKPLSHLAKVLGALHLYRDPLEKLLYKP